MWFPNIHEGLFLFTFIATVINVWRVLSFILFKHATILRILTRIKSVNFIFKQFKTNLKHWFYKNNLRMLSELAKFSKF